MTDFAKRLLELFTAEELAEMIGGSRCVFCKNHLECGGEVTQEECADGIFSAQKEGEK